MGRALGVVLSGVANPRAPLSSSNNVEYTIAGMQSQYSNGSQPPGANALKLLNHVYPEREKFIHVPMLTGQSLYEFLIPNTMDILKES